MKNGGSSLRSRRSERLRNENCRRNDGDHGELHDLLS